MDNVHPIFQDIMKPFLPTGLTTQQRIAVAEEINHIMDANTKLLRIINEMEDTKKAYALLSPVTKISESCADFFMLIK